jgi:hypothetical protein
LFAHVEINNEKKNEKSGRSARKVRLDLGNTRPQLATV